MSIASVGLKWLLLATLVLPASLCASEDPHRDHQGAAKTAPGYFPLAFPAPAAGSYSLPVIGSAADGEVLLDTGQRRRLHQIFDDKLVVLSFIYTHCPDPNGCPLASYVLAQLQKQITQHRSLSQRVKLISLSFDPDNDPPHILAAYGRHFRSPLGQWEFVTTEGHQQLQPILDSYNQWVTPVIGPQGQATGMLSHLLRVYLIDPQNRIRNIYSTSYLHPRLLLADLQTLAAEKPD
ncbi:SCO family protein [Ferrimonas sp. SCSIO 43195]|uniref:SCO family protein n=1 Tax=Ferrimonas sp. SCSIO 43195 TaxID=2822844 RepID=UPI0020765AED|nr:SCO family protein [Ferrimonas sp. SCSIO 43195]USD36080.1 SCO family protein [Ferrimonas sp. SCSIO 43195]